MKVLFAVSNEEISESIVKKYQKEYKQIISYKNVYYFNAILKEIQKDKSYDRIVISEDLESFANSQYNQIDKFLFEKLDSISDEASNTRGNDIPIILICSDRRNKSDQLLIKLFGIGIYDAIIGNDRSIDEVCKLINRPRAKKEAKTYYKIDSEEVNYQAENENDVSEMEIQNILAHYKRLGKDEDRYVDSFNNIAAQYNDTQLRIISKFLPLNVRAVLEEKSTKYQQIMSFNNVVSDSLRNKDSQKQPSGPSEKLLRMPDKPPIMSNPVVIPSAVNMSESKKLSKPKQQNRIETQVQPDQMTTYKVHSVQQSESVEVASKNYVEPQNTVSMEPQQEQNQMIQPEIIEEQPDPKPVKRGRGRPRKNPIPDANQTPVKKRGRGRPRKNPIPEEPTILPGFEENKSEVQDTTPKVEEAVTLPGFNDINENPAVLPGFDDFEDVEEKKEPTVLPGFEENTDVEDSSVLPGFDDYQNNRTSNINNNFEKNTNTNSSYNDYSNYGTGYNNSYNNTSSFNNEYENSNNKYSVSQSQTRTERGKNYENTIDLSGLLTPDKKIVTFVGTSKNGTSFIVNNVAEYMSSIGINTAILDTTKNKNSYYIYTKNEEQLRNIAVRSIENLAQGVAQGISVNKNFTVYTSLPEDDDAIVNVDEILQTLLQNHSLILIDTDFDSPVGYFKQSQETYLVQSLDILTIQPLTAFLNELKYKNILDENKLRIILNKVVKIRGITEKVIIGGMANYNDPSMSNMIELFDRNTIKYVSIPFEEEIYTLYLKGIIECDVSLKGYSKMFMQTLKQLANMIYPLTQTNNKYTPPSAAGYGRGNFTPNMNNTLDQMKRNY